LHSRANVVQYVLLALSSALITRLVLGLWSWSNIELRLSDFFFQNSISTSGVGWRPSFSCVSGSCLSTSLICFVQVTTVLSRSEIRLPRDDDDDDDIEDDGTAFSSSSSPPSYSGGVGSRVSALTWPQSMDDEERKEWKQS